MVFYDDEEECLVGEGCFDFLPMSEEDRQKERKKRWQAKGKTIVDLMVLFYTVWQNTVKLDQKVKDIRIFDSGIDESSISFLKRSFNFVNEHVGYLDKDKNPKAFKEFRATLNSLLDNISEVNEAVSAIHIPPLPPTYYSFKDFLSFFLMVTESPVNREYLSRKPERAFSRHANFFYHTYMKKADKEDFETYADEEEKPSPTQFSRAEITVLHGLALSVKEFFWKDGVDYFPSCLPKDIREFASVLSLQGEIWSEGPHLESILAALKSLNKDLDRFREDFRNFIKHTIPMPFIGQVSQIRKCSKVELDDEDF